MVVLHAVHLRALPGRLLHPHLGLADLRVQCMLLPWMHVVSERMQALYACMWCPGRCTLGLTAGSDRSGSTPSSTLG